MTARIMISAGEASGDLHGANLINSLRARVPDLQVSGMGGTELAGQGIEILFDAARVSVVGIFEVLSHLRDILAAQRTLRRHLVANPPDLLILIDLPDFNLRLAKKAKKLGIPVFYYISPQVWAWRSGRVTTLRDRVDKIGVILPFEEEFFRRHGVDAEYVGHPLLDAVKTSGSRPEFFRQHGISGDARCIGLFPGSRKREVASLLPIFLAAAQIMDNTSSDKLVFVIPQAPTIAASDLAAAGLAEFARHIDIRVLSEDRYEMMAACDAVIAASGTVTLELAILEVPMVVAYKLSPLTYLLGKLLVNLDHFSLVNLIAGRAAVPELLQKEVTPEKVAEELTAMLQAEKRRTTLAALRQVKDKLGSRGASDKAAEVALRLMGRDLHG